MLRDDAVREAMYYVCENLYTGFREKAPHEQENIVEYWCMVFEEKYQAQVNKDNEYTSFEELCKAFSLHNEACKVSRNGSVARYCTPMKAVIVVKVKSNGTGELVNLPEEQRSFLINSFDPYFSDKADYISGTALDGTHYGIYPMSLYPKNIDIERIYSIEE